MTVEEIKSLMRSGDVAGAENAAQELLSADSDNIQAMMLYGACRQLQGDEATFRDTYATVKERLEAKPEALDEDTKVAWDRFGELYAKFARPRMTQHKSVSMEHVVLAVVFVATVVIGAWFFGGEILRMIGIESISGIESHVDCAAAIESHVDCAADIDHRGYNTEEARFTDKFQAGKELILTDEK